LRSISRSDPAAALTFLSPSVERAVGHEPQSLSDVRRADAASWKYGRCAGVAFRFQVSENKVEPAPSNRRLNLLTKDCSRSALADERCPRRPQMTFVIGRLAAAGCAEWLAGVRACPNRSVIGPSGEAQGDAPSSDAGEEMALRVFSEVTGPHVNNASLIHIPRGNVSSINEIAEPLCGIWVCLVVIGGHWKLLICTVR
jgi:hypothetical protein